jgi:hypothetical protein
MGYLSKLVDPTQIMDCDRPITAVCGNAVVGYRGVRLSIDGGTC